jgi:hypothetical protein
MLVNLVSDNFDNAMAVVAAGALPLQVEMLSSGSDEGRSNASVALGNLMTGNPANKRAVAAAGAITPLVVLLSRGSLWGKAKASEGCNDIGEPHGR